MDGAEDKVITAVNAKTIVDFLLATLKTNKLEGIVLVHSISSGLRILSSGDSCTSDDEISAVAAHWLAIQEPWFRRMIFRHEEIIRNEISAGRTERILPKDFGMNPVA